MQLAEAGQSLLLKHGSSIPIRGVKATGTSNKPGTIWISKFMMEKGIVLVFQDAYKLMLVNTDDGN